MARTTNKPPIYAAPPAVITTMMRLSKAALVDIALVTVSDLLGVSKSAITLEDLTKLNSVLAQRGDPTIDPAKIRAKDQARAARAERDRNRMVVS